MFDIIRFRAKQNLALRGHRENDISANRGKFLESVHLIAKYDPVLREHLVRSKVAKFQSLIFYQKFKMNLLQFWKIKFANILSDK